MGPNPVMTGVHVKRGNLDTETCTGRMCRYRQKMYKMMLLQAKEHQRFPANNHN